MKDLQPLVSVVICFFNEEKFLDEAIQSVLMQDYTHWELILVDDGSSDGSAEIAHKYVQGHAGKIIYLSHDHLENRGLSASRNLGISKAQGIWIAPLDADDVWLPQKLSAQLAIATSVDNLGMLCEASIYWYSWENDQLKDITVPVGDGTEYLAQPPELLKKLYPLGNGSAPCPCGILVLRDAWEKVGGFESSFRGDLQLYEDQAFLNKIYFQFPVYIKKEPHNLYRQRKGSIVQDVRAKGKYYEVRLHFLQWFYNYLSEKNASAALLAKVQQSIKMTRKEQHPSWVSRLAKRWKY